MSEAKACTPLCSHYSTDCSRRDFLLVLEVLWAIDVVFAKDGLIVTVETGSGIGRCPAYGVVRASRGCRDVMVIDASSCDGPLHMIWRKRKWKRVESTCWVGSFTEQNGWVRARLLDFVPGRSGTGYALDCRRCRSFAMVFKSRRWIRFRGISGSSQSRVEMWSEAAALE